MRRVHPEDLAVGDMIGLADGCCDDVHEIVDIDLAHCVMTTRYRCYFYDLSLKLLYQNGVLRIAESRETQKLKAELCD